LGSEIKFRVAVIVLGMLPVALTAIVIFMQKAASVGGLFRARAKLAAPGRARRGESSLMADDPFDESAAALRVKAEYYRNVAELVGEGTRARLIQMATEFLERAVKLEHRKK
jgi:hypothetical protein